MLDIARVLRIDQRTDMEASDAGVSVISGAGTVLMDNVSEADKKFRKLRRFDGAVFNKRDRFSVAFHSEQKAEAGLSHFPDLRLLCLIKCAHIAISGLVRVSMRLPFIELGPQIRFVFAIELDQREGRRVGPERNPSVVKAPMKIAPG